MSQGEISLVGGISDSKLGGTSFDSHSGRFILGPFGSDVFSHHLGLENNVWRNLGPPSPTQIILFRIFLDRLESVIYP